MYSSRLFIINETKEYVTEDVVVLCDDSKEQFLRTGCVRTEGV